MCLLCKDAWGRMGGSRDDDRREKRGEGTSARQVPPSAEADSLEVTDQSTSHRLSTLTFPGPDRSRSSLQERRCPPSVVSRHVA